MIPLVQIAESFGVAEKVIEDWQSEGYSAEVLDKVLYRNAASYFGCAAT